MKIRLAALLPALFATAPLAAQDISPALDPTSMIGHAGTIAADQHLRREMGARLASRSAAPTRARSGPSLPQVMARTAFRPDPAVRQQVYARAVAQMQKVNPADAAKLKQELVSGRMRKAVADYLARYGMSANNLVDTTAVYLAAAWFASRASTGDPTPAQFRGLRAQVASVYATMPQVLGASNAVKQELSEANIFQAWVSSSVANEAARNPRASARARAAVVQGVKASYQLDLSRMNLTAQGLR